MEMAKMVSGKKPVIEQPRVESFQRSFPRPLKLLHGVFQIKMLDCKVRIHLSLFSTLNLPFKTDVFLLLECRKVADWLKSPKAAFWASSSQNADWLTGRFGEVRPSSLGREPSMMNLLNASFVIMLWIINPIAYRRRIHSFISRSFNQIVGLFTIIGFV
jgi:hypothetical protein